MNHCLQNAFLGSLVADAVAMPVHWYYNTMQLDRQVGHITGYLAPKNPHADSILWRSKYQPKNKDADILHDQAQYWGQRGVHYHQFLKAGENTLNYRLATELYQQVTSTGHYDADAWLEKYVICMRTPGWHRDTYVEEYHRAFFENRAQGIPLRKCGIDDLHIGGLSHVPALIAALDAVGVSDPALIEHTVVSHIALTHRNRFVDQAARAMTGILLALSSGADLRPALEQYASTWAKPDELANWAKYEDRQVVGRHLSPACYLPESFSASLHFCWKYAEDFTSGILANAHCGGDNCHRGAVVGSFLAAANGIAQPWLDGLVAQPLPSTAA